MINFFYGQMADKIREFINSNPPGSGPHEFDIGEGKKFFDRLYVMRNKGTLPTTIKFKTRTVEGKLLAWRIS